MKIAFKHIEIFSILMLFALSGNAQYCDEFLVNAGSDPSQIYVVESTDVTRKEIKRQLNIVKQELLNDLRVKMAEKILIEVKSVTISGITESGESHKSFFNAETEITSAAILSEGEAKYCVDVKNKQVYGIYALNREKTASRTLLDCQNRLIQLIAEVQAESGSSDKVDTGKYKDRFEKIKRDARVVVYLNPNADLRGFSDQLQVYNRVFSKFIETSNRDKYIEEYALVERILFNEDFETGIRRLRNLMLDFPHKEQLVELLTRSEMRYKMANQMQVGSFEAQGRYSEALSEMYTYCAVISCTNDDYEQINQLTTAYFNAEITKLENAIKQDQKSVATLHITTLKSLASANPKRYKQANDAYNAYLINSEMREVERDLYRKNYHSAFAKVRRIENTYGSDYNSFQSLKRSTIQQLLRSEIRLEKQKRRKLYSLALGTGVFTNSIKSVEYIDQQIQTLTWFYSAGLYKKLNYKIESQNYPKKSDVIGIRFRVLDYKTTTKVQHIESLENSKYYRYDTELAVDGTLLRAFHYAFGVVFSDRKIESDLLYTAELGLNIPIHPISIQVNARGLFYNPKPVYTLSAGLYLHLDFWRKFNSKDKKDIRNKLGLF